MAWKLSNSRFIHNFVSVNLFLL